MREHHRYPDESSYQTIIEPQVLSNGRRIFMARHPELRGCLAQGDSPAEAEELLSEVFRSYIEHLREYNLPVPQPRQRAVRTAVWSISGRQGLMAASAIRSGVIYGMQMGKPRTYYSRMDRRTEPLTSGTR